MAGNTATIDRDVFSADWHSYVPIAVLCVRHTITKDQVIRLRTIWNLDRRMDCTRRAKPPRAKPPTASDLQESGATLDLSPAVAAAAARVRQEWDDETERRKEAEKHAGEQARVVARRFHVGMSIPDDGRTGRYMPGGESGFEGLIDFLDE